MMAKKAKPKAEHRWRISLKGAATQFLGHLEAADAESAIKKAAARFKIAGVLRNRIVVRRED